MTSSEAPTTGTSDTIGTDPVWLPWFRAPHLLTVRPVSGDPDTALLVENGLDGASATIWDARTGERSEPLPFDAGYEILLSRDRRWIVQLDDDGGSEVGHLVARPLDGGPAVDLAPGREPYVVRGMEFSVDGSAFTASIVDEEGYHLLVVALPDAATPGSSWGPAHVVSSTRNEAWYGRISSDGAFVSFDTTEQNPGIRRAAVTVFAVDDHRVVGVADDLPAGPVRAVRFSTVPGDQRVLLSTERTGWTRPAIWNPLDDSRQDFDLSEFDGELIPLDWDTAANRVLLLHVDAGVHRLLCLDPETGVVTVVRSGTGSYADPDVAGALHYYASSYLGGGGIVRVFEQSWNTPPHLVDVALDGSAVGAAVLRVAPADVPAGIPFTSSTVTSADGTALQLWWALPEGEVRGTVLEVHGGPNLVTVDHYSPTAQAWLAAGYAYASLNYRGSVTFGRDFREGFWGSAGDREIEDVSAAVQWLRDLGSRTDRADARSLGDPASTFITGPSYGGHLTLLSLGRLPELFAGGFAHVAMADWAAAFEDMNPAVRLVWLSFLRNGDLPVDEAIAHFSPISHVASVTGSVWLSQGSRDTRTPPAQAQSYVDKLLAHGGDALIEWYDAGHEPVGLRGPEEAQFRMEQLAGRTLAGLPWRD